MRTAGPGPRSRIRQHRTVRAARLLIAAAMAFTYLAPTVVPASATPTVPDCNGLVFSPTFAADHTVMCLARVPTYYVSHDGGHTWGQARTLEGASSPMTVVFSPWFDRDHTLWAASTATIWVSHDGAHSFTTFDTLNGSPDGWGLRPFVTPADAGGPARVALLAWDYGVIGPGSNGNEYVEVNGRMQTIPMVGTPNAEVADYLVPPNISPTTPARALAFPFVQDSDKYPITTPAADAAQIRDCLPAYACVNVHFSTPLGSFAPAAYGDLEPSGSYVLAAADKTTGIYSAYRTSDYGNTWTRWTSLEQLIPRPAGPCGDYCEVSTLSVSAAPDAPRKMFVLVENGRIDETSDPATLRAERTPDIQLFRSDDAGAHWRRIGQSYLPGQIASPRSNLPFNYSLWQFNAEAGHRLYVVGNYVDRLHPTHTAYFGTWCSTNDGLTWHKATC